MKLMANNCCNIYVIIILKGACISTMFFCVHTEQELSAKFYGVFDHEVMSVHSCEW